MDRLWTTFALALCGAFVFGAVAVLVMALIDHISGRAPDDSGGETNGARGQLAFSASRLSLFVSATGCLLLVVFVHRGIKEIGRLTSGLQQQEELLEHQSLQLRSLRLQVAQAEEARGRVVADKPVPARSIWLPGTTIDYSITNFLSGLKLWGPGITKSYVPPEAPLYDAPPPGDAPKVKRVQ
jgi:hypothetical protein